MELFIPHSKENYFDKVRSEPTNEITLVKEKT